MAEYIERKTIIELLEKNLAASKPGSWEELCYSEEINLVKGIPAADVAPVRHGRWLFVTNGQMASAWCCSECGRTVVITCDEELRKSKLEKEYPFCHCGTKMDLEEM